MTKHIITKYLHSLFQFREVPFSSTESTDNKISDDITDISLTDICADLVAEEFNTSFGANYKTHFVSKLKFSKFGISSQSLRIIKSSSLACLIPSDNALY